MTLNDAQVSLGKVLKPYRNFEAAYEGLTRTTPVAFFAADENGDRNPRDPDAGRAGFAPNLLRYVDVPLGARILLYIPACVSAADEVIQQHDYVYQVTFRMRTTTDYRQRGTPFHLARQLPGQSDTTDLTNPSRLVIPASSNTVIIHQAEASGSAAQQNHLRRESIEFLSTFATGDYSQLPVFADGTPGVHQQGVLDPALFPLFPNVPGGALFMPWWFDADGDQMLITAVKPDIVDELVWDFLGVDAPFSNIYGQNVAGPTHADFPDIGIYMFQAT